MMKPGTHGVSVGTDTQNTAKRFRRSAYALGSARVRSRYSHDPGPSPIPPGGDSFGSFAAKLGSAVLAGRNNREFRDQERQNATLADEKNTLELEALRQKLAPGKNHYLTAEGKGLDLSDEQAALYEHRNREKDPSPERVHQFTEQDNPLGLPIRAGGWPESQMGQYLMDRRAGKARDAAKDRAKDRAARPHYGAVGSVLNAQESDLYKRIEDHTRNSMAAYQHHADSWLNDATNWTVTQTPKGEESVRRLGIDPDMLKKLGSGPQARQTLEEAQKRLVSQHEKLYRAQAQRIHGVELEKIRSARTELGAAVGDEAGIDLGGEEESAIRPEFQAVGDAMRAARGSRR